MSDKPVIERLQVKNGRTLAVIGAPRGLDAGLSAATAAQAPAEADVVLAFFSDRASLEAALPTFAGRLKPGVILWIAYPKLTSPLAGDLNRNLIHDLTPAHGWDTISQIAVDPDWSAMRLKRI